MAGNQPELCSRVGERLSNDAVGKRIVISPRDEPADKSWHVQNPNWFDYPYSHRIGASEGSPLEPSIYMDQELWRGCALQHQAVSTRSELRSVHGSSTRARDRDSNRNVHH